GDVAVRDELDAGAGLAHLVDQLLVPGPVQDDHRDVLRVAALGPGHRADVVGDGGVDVDDVGRGRSGDQLLHVEHGGRVEHGAARGHREHRDRVGHAHRGQPGAVDGVHRDVALGAVAVADPLAVVQHGGVVFLTLTD